MYSERDYSEIRHRIRKKSIILGILLVVILGIYIFSFLQRIKWLAMVSGALLFAVACFGFTFVLLPDIRYRNFLVDLSTRLTQEIKGTILSIAEKAEPQDGVMVFPIHILQESDQDDHIVYLNSAKADGFPPVGSNVVLQCSGRHIREITSVEKK